MKPQQKYVGTFDGSPYYHQTRKWAPMWAACRAEMFTEQIPVGDVRLDVALKPCPACFRDKES